MFLIGLLTVFLWENQFFKSLQDKVSGPSGSEAYSGAKTRDQAFDWINDEWLGKDTREDWEIVEDRLNTRHQLLSINTSDGTDYVYRAFKAPFKNSDNALFIVLDCVTMTVLFDDTVKAESQIKGSMFEKCPEVKRMKKLNKSQGLTTDQLRQKTQRMVAGQAGMPMYGRPTPAGGRVQQPQGGSDDDNESESGDDE